MSEPSVTYCPKGCNLNLAPGICEHGYSLHNASHLDFKDDQNTLDLIARLRAQSDQLGASANGIATTINGYMNTLLQGGMERAEAHELTLMYQHLLLHTILDLPCTDTDE